MIKKYYLSQREIKYGHKIIYFHSFDLIRILKRFLCTHNTFTHKNKWWRRRGEKLLSLQLLSSDHWLISISFTSLCFFVFLLWLLMHGMKNEWVEMRWGPLLCIILYACLSVKDNFVVVNRSQFVSFIFLFTSIISALIPHLTLNTNVYIPLHQQYQKRVLHRSIHSSLAFFTDVCLICEHYLS